MNSNSIALDGILICEESENNKDLVFEQKYDEELPTEIYEDSHFGIALCENNELRRKVIDEITVKANENVELYYHAGGYESTENMIIFLEVGMKQQNINNQEYIYVQGENKKISYGKINFNAPCEIGKYEVIGWIINNPYNPEEKLSELQSTFRFTLNVE